MRDVDSWWCWRVIHNDKQSSFTELLAKAGFVLIHMKHVQFLLSAFILNDISK